MKEKFMIGKKVKISNPDSWTDNKEGIITGIVTSSDELTGYIINIPSDKCITIVEPQYLEVLKS